MGKHSTNTAGERWRLRQVRADIAAGWKRLDCESILPSQLDDTLPDTGVKRFARALLEDAVDVLRAARFKKRAGLTFYESENDYWDAAEWLFEEPENGRICSLAWVCEALGLDPDYIRSSAGRAGLKPTRKRKKHYGARIYVLSDDSIERFRKKRPMSRTEYWQKRWEEKRGKKDREQDTARGITCRAFEEDEIL